MFSRRLGSSIVIVAAVIVVGVSAYNIVNANSSNGSGIGTTAIPTPTPAKRFVSIASRRPPPRPVTASHPNPMM
jgi:hypothetical protein